ncbi:MAG: hypothetical protein GF311_21395 [Candidatus Lokiarchaeota archaeon]|nr:hypothetical protein [Candidatus Lokiarchaeota archaeon]
MSKKLVFVGPSGAGKTTIRKIFFEGENASKLLEYAIEPTYGEESLIFRLFEEEIGVFDLAGQENRRWFESKDRTVFLDAGIIIIVIEAATKIQEIVNFIENVLKVKEELTLKSNIYLFIHKIDLLGEIEMQVLKRDVKTHLRDINLTKIYFTSIKSEYFIQTFSYLIEIIRSNIDKDISKNILSSDFLNEIIRTLYYFNKEVILTEKEMHLKLKLSDQLLEKIINHLLDKGHIDYTKADKKRIYNLTENGKSQFEYITKKFNLDNLYRLENDIVIPEFPTKKEIPAFIGFFISDENGKTFSKAELYDGALKEFLANKDLRDLDDGEFDAELIPMFISALEKFSREINIKNLSGFNLEGINLKMYIFNYDSFTITLFVHPDINLEVIEYKIKRFFSELFEKYEREFETFLQTGKSSKGTEIKKKSRRWLEKLNERYEQMINGLKSYDIKHAEELYRNLDDLQEELFKKTSELKEKIKKLKVKLTKAILEKDFELIKNIAKKSQKIKTRYID